VDAATDLLFEQILDVVEEPPVDLGDGTERVTVRTASPGGSTTFFQVQVVLQ
jgi:hypothetical protein